MGDFQGLCLFTRGYPIPVSPVSPAVAGDAGPHGNGAGMVPTDRGFETGENRCGKKTWGNVVGI